MWSRIEIITATLLFFVPLQPHKKGGGRVTEACEAPFFYTQK
jgi:hypothetical protein